MTTEPAPGADTTAPIGRAYRLAVVGLALLVLAASFAWAFTMPAFGGPDERVHYNSVSRVLSGGGWPRPYDAKMEQWTITAIVEGGATYLGQSLDEVPPPEERSLLFEGGGWSKAGDDQMVQHPPAYYVVAAGAVALAGGAELRWDEALLVMRMTSALLVAAAVPFLVGIGRRVTRSPVAGLVGGAAVLFIPFFTNAAGYVTNDSLLVLGCSASLYFVLRAADSPARPLWWLAGSGAALGGALATKGLALMLIPVIAVLTVMAVRPAFGWLRSLLWALWPLGIAFVLGGWWWARNILILGRIQPSLLGQRESTGVAHPDYDLGYFLTNAILRLNRTFWGRGARTQYALPELVVDIAGIVLLIAIVVAFVVARRRVVLLMLWAFPLLILATTLVNAHGIFFDTGLAGRGIQGRYLYPGIAAVAATVAVLFHWLTGRLGARARALCAGGVIAVGALSTAGALAYVALRVWNSGEGVSGAFAGMRDGLGTAVAPYIAIAIVGAAAVVLAVSATVALREDPVRPAVED